MYNYTISDDETKKISEKAKDYSDLINNFKNVDDKYKQNTNDLVLERKTFEKPTVEQIESTAQNSLAEYKDNSLKGIEEEYSTKAKNIDDSIEKIKDMASLEKQETKQNYGELKTKASNDALKRGLSRSSIVVNILDAFDKEMLDKIDKINSEIEGKISSLNGQKELLSNQRQNALNSFDISYALKLSNKIDEINKQLNAEEQKVLEYNNQIAQKEADYQEKRMKSNLDYASFIEKYGEDAFEKMKREEKYNYAKDYFLNLPKAEAIQEIENDKTFRAELGSEYFNKLKVLINSQKD